MKSKKDEQWIDKKLAETLSSLNDLFDGETDTQKSKLETLESHKQKQVLALQQKAESLFAQYQKAFDLILERLIQSNTIISDASEKKAILNEIKIGQENIKQIIDSEKLAEKINTGQKSFLSILKYSRNTIETFYNLGILLSEEENYEDALAMFTFLSLIEPGCHQFWLREAMCLQILGRFKEAIEVFQLAETTDSTDPLPSFFASECYSNLEDRPHAITAADRALEIAGNHTEKEYLDFITTVTQWKEKLMR